MKRSHVNFIANLLAQVKTGPADPVLLDQAFRLIDAERRNWQRQDANRAAYWAKRRAARAAERTSQDD